MGRNSSKQILRNRGARVALHAEGVGRNSPVKKPKPHWKVALHAEGVGRNLLDNMPFHDAVVALHAEGVGRNPAQVSNMAASVPSPSMRRAWVEMQANRRALFAKTPSPSMRRAWVEMSRLYR